MLIVFRLRVEILLLRQAADSKIFCLASGRFGVLDALRMVFHHESRGGLQLRMSLYVLSKAANTQFDVNNLCSVMTCSKGSTATFVQ